jgi:hypothetical protein
MSRRFGAGKPSRFGRTSATSGTFALVELAYARVSTAKQDLDRQIEALLEVGIARDRIYADKRSGATVDRPGTTATTRAQNPPTTTPIATGAGRTGLTGADPRPSAQPPRPIHRPKSPQIPSKASPARP